MSHMNDLQRQLKVWLADQLRTAGHGSRKALAEALGVRPDAITRMTNLKAKEMRDISLDEAAVMGRFFKSTPPSGIVAAREQPPAATRSRDVQAKIPLLDKVAAGKLKSPSSQIPIEDVPLLAFADLGRGDFFALSVEGDSMDRISPDGSTIVVNKADRTLISGKPYVFSIRGEATYKIWRPDPPRLEPNSTNPANQAIFLRPKQDPENLVVGRVKRTVLDL